MQLQCRTKAVMPPAAAIASLFLSSNDKFHRAPAASCLFVSKNMKFHMVFKRVEACEAKYTNITLQLQLQKKLKRVVKLLHKTHKHGGLQ